MDRADREITLDKLIKHTEHMYNFIRTFDTEREADFDAWRFYIQQLNTLSQPIIENTLKTRIKREEQRVVCVETGIIYKDAQEAAKAVGSSYSNIWSCLIGNSKSSCGFIWRFFKDEDIKDDK